MRALISAFLAFTFVLVTAAPMRGQQRRLTQQRTHVGPRTALVIGNRAYKIGPLQNPVNDARAMEQVLTELGFKVIRRENLSQKEMERAIRDFGAKLAPDAVGLFYYAGHGVQINGENYIVPVDAAPDNADELEDSAVKVSNVLRRMERDGEGMNIMILDACRNNPFARTFRSVSDGLAQMDANEHTMDTFIAFAAAADRVASDGGSSGNGVFTQELLRHMRVPGLSIDQVFTRVTAGVFYRTQKRQRPWVSRSLRSEFSFAPATDSGPEKQIVAASPVEAGSSSRNMAQELYNSGQFAESGPLRGFAFGGSERDLAKAAALYQEAVKLEPTNARYQYSLGRALIEDYKQKYAQWDSDREREEALVARINGEAWKRSRGGTVFMPPALPGGPPQSIYLPPTYPETVGPLMRFDQPGLSVEAIPALRAAVRLEPENAVYRSELIKAWYEHGVEPSKQPAGRFGKFGILNGVEFPVTVLESLQSPKAEKEADVREVLGLEPNNAKLHSILGDVLVGKAKLAEAEAEFREAVRLEPQTIYFHSRLAEVLGSQLKWAEAVEEYRQATLLAPNDKNLKKALKEAVKNQKRSKR